MSDQAIPIPPLSVLCKLGSIAIHAEEFLSPEGHELDRLALKALLGDVELREWLERMNAAALLPVKRGVTS